MGHLFSHGFCSGALNHDILLPRVCLCPAFLVLRSGWTGGNTREMLEPAYTANVLQPERYLQHCTRCQHLPIANAHVVESSNATTPEIGSRRIV